MATIITNVTELQAMVNDLAGDYVLGNDIDALVTVGWNGGAGFEPIGSFASPFTGTFDMVGYTISNLYINRPTENAGLFGWLTGATIINGTLADVDITGICGGVLAYITTGTIITSISTSGSVEQRNEASGLVAYARTGTAITDCHSSCTVLASCLGDNKTYSGGLVVEAQGATLTDCSFTGTVTTYGEARTGGIVGHLDNASTMSQCHNTGNIVGYDYGVFVGGYFGGLVGVTDDGSPISNSYNRGNVSVETPASAYIGGLVGWIDNAADSIMNSYSTGAVPGAGTVGGLIGYRRDGSTLTACFWDTETSGTSDGVGNGAETGATGKTTSLMKIKSTFTNASWDFIVIWAIGVPNDGYPFFWAMPPEGEEALPDSPRETVAVEDEITLEMIRNVEMAARGRFFIDEEGKAVYKSRHARNP